MKDQACALVETYKKDAVFTKLETATDTVHVYTNQEWATLSPFTKEEALKATALCYLDVEGQGRVGYVEVYDHVGRKVDLFLFKKRGHQVEVINQ